MWKHLLVLEVILAIGIALFVAPACNVSSISSHVTKVLADDGVAMEAFPFKIGDYNREVRINYPGEKGIEMSLQYPEDSMAYIFIYDVNSSPWEKPHMLKTEFNKIQQALSGTCFNKSSMHFIEANKMRKTASGLFLPVVHVSTAAHVAGGAFYHQRNQILNEPQEWSQKTIYGISIHEKFGLRTRFSGVIVFEELVDADFTPRAPVGVATEEEKIRLLTEANLLG